MTFEEHVANFNGEAFWREFTFAQNTFSPNPSKELELAALQLKERDHPTNNPPTSELGLNGKFSAKARSKSVIPFNS